MNAKASYLEPGSLWSLIERRAEATPDALFTVDEEDRRKTYSDYRNEALRAAAGLRARGIDHSTLCLLYTSPSPRDATLSRMPSSA